MNKVKGAGKGRVWRKREEKTGDSGVCQEERRSPALGRPWKSENHRGIQLAS